MNTVVCTAAVAPMMAEPGVRAEQVTQLLLGETAELVAAEGAWRRLRTHAEGYEGWVSAGYLLELEPAAAAEWIAAAVLRSDGAAGETDDEAGATVRLPLGARVAVAPRGAGTGPASAARVLLPDGRVCTVREGRVRPAAEIAAEARSMPPEAWALAHFGGAPYEWGGRTPWGVDCSGLVQATYAARGIQLPRDSGQQVGEGAPVDPAAMQPGDLLFFRSETGRDVITHIAFLAAGDTLIHSTIDRGGVVHEPWGDGHRAQALRGRLVAVRRV